MHIGKNCGDLPVNYPEAPVWENNNVQIPRRIMAIMALLVVETFNTTHNNRTIRTARLSHNLFNRTMDYKLLGSKQLIAIRSVLYKPEVREELLDVIEEIFGITPAEDDDGVYGVGPSLEAYIESQKLQNTAVSSPVGSAEYIIAMKAANRLLAEIDEWFVNHQTEAFVACKEEGIDMPEGFVPLKP